MILQYSFSQPVGDSIIFHAGGGPAQYKIVLDSIKTQFICNQNRRVLYYSKYQGSCTDSLRIIEGIGPVNGYLFTEAIGACDMGPGQHYFNCANIVTCSYPSACSPAVHLSVEGIKKDPMLKVLQENETITLLSDIALSGELELKDILGRTHLLLTLKNQERINFPVTGLPTGIYFVQLSSNKGDLCRKIIIE